VEAALATTLACVSSSVLASCVTTAAPVVAEGEVEDEGRECMVSAMLVSEGESEAASEEEEEAAGETECTKGGYLLSGEACAAACCLNQLY
jgi:hypothetical protein